MPQDDVEAYFWYSLSGAYKAGERIEKHLASHLTPEQKVSVAKRIEASQQAIYRHQAVKN